MAIAICPKCRFEFIAADEFGQPERCPACGERFVLATAPQSNVATGESAEPAKPTASAPLKPIGPAARLASAVGIGLGVLADMVLGGLAMFYYPAGPEAFAGLMLLLCAVVGHGIAGFMAFVYLKSAPRRTVLSLRVGLACWVVFGGAGLALGGRFWPATVGQWRDLLLWVAGGTFVGLLGYLAMLEWLADRVGESSDKPAGGVARWVRPAAGVMLMLNAALAAGLAFTVVPALRRGADLGALLGSLAGGALALYLLWAAIGLLRLATQPTEAALALPRAVMALLAGAMTLAMASMGGLIWPAVPPAALAVALAADVLIVWYCHWRLAPPAQ
jgi:hypothetical protein